MRIPESTQVDFVHSLQRFQPPSPKTKENPRIEAGRFRALVAAVSTAQSQNKGESTNRRRSISCTRCSGFNRPVSQSLVFQTPKPQFIPPPPHPKTPSTPSPPPLPQP